MLNVLFFCLGGDFFILKDFKMFNKLENIEHELKQETKV